MDQVEVVVAHQERAVVRVGDVFLKIDGNNDRVDLELAAMARAPVPTPTVLWRRHPVLALARVPGTPLSELGASSRHASRAWAAAGEMLRSLHDAPVSGEWPAWYGADAGTFLAAECAWLVDHDVLGSDIVAAAQQVATIVVRRHEPVVIHGDMQPDHVFVDHGAVTGVIDWADACLMDPLFDLAVLTVGHPGHLAEVIDGYGRDVDRDLIRGWWTLRRLGAIRWLVEHGFDASREVSALRADAASARAPGA